MISIARIHQTHWHQTSTTPRAYLCRRVPRIKRCTLIISRREIKTPVTMIMDKRIELQITIMNSRCKVKNQGLLMSLSRIRTIFPKSTKWLRMTLERGLNVLLVGANSKKKRCLSMRKFARKCLYRSLRCSIPSNSEK